MSIKKKNRLLDKPMCPLPDGDPNDDFDDMDYGTQYLRCPACGGFLPPHNDFNFCPWCRQALDYTHIDYYGNWEECVHELVYSNIIEVNHGQPDDYPIKLEWRMCICSKCGEIIWEIDDCWKKENVNQEYFLKLQGGFYDCKGKI